ncbi:MAG: pilus assembly protein [Rhodospirillaceae bacterium]|nr:pilus assembly protein [Rhodospirillaceae bacterium]MCK5546658.1 pilus assembly protein [Rhodospirillaceae bacterium]
MLNKPTILKIAPLVRKFSRAEDGVSAVEMALVAPVLMIIFMGLIDYGIAVFSKMELTSSVRSGAQYALVKSEIKSAGAAAIAASAANMAAIQTTIIDSSNLNPAKLVVPLPYKTCECSNGDLDATCTITCPSGTLRHYVVISATYTYVPYFLPNDIVLTNGSTIRVQ